MEQDEAEKIAADAVDHYGNEDERNRAQHRRVLTARVTAYGEQSRRAGAEAMCAAAMEAAACTGAPIDTDAAIRRAFHALPSAAEAASPAAGWRCAAKVQGTAGGNEPAECDWPVCGCDPYADKVIVALSENGTFLEALKAKLNQDYPAPSEEARAG